MSRHSQDTRRAVADRDRSRARLRVVTATAAAVSVIATGGVAFALPGTQHTASSALGRCLVRQHGDVRRPGRRRIGQLGHELAPARAVQLGQEQEPEQGRQRAGRQFGRRQRHLRGLVMSRHRAAGPPGRFPHPGAGSPPLAGWPAATTRRRGRPRAARQARPAPSAWADPDPDPDPGPGEVRAHDERDHLKHGALVRQPGYRHHLPGPAHHRHGPGHPGEPAGPAARACPGSRSPGCTATSRCWPSASWPCTSRRPSPTRSSPSAWPRS